MNGFRFVVRWFVEAFAVESRRIESPKLLSCLPISFELDIAMAELRARGNTVSSEKHRDVSFVARLVRAWPSGC